MKNALTKTTMTILAAGLLSACMMTPEQSRLENRYEPQVSQARFVHPLSPDHSVKLRVISAHHFLDAFNAGYGDVVYVRGGDELDREDLALELKRSRPDLQVYLIKGYVKTPASLLLERTVAVVPGCGNWSAQTSRQGDQEPPPGFGCSTNANLARMVANPADLTHGRTPGPADAETYTDVIQAVREGRFEVVTSEIATTE